MAAGRAVPSTTHLLTSLARADGLLFSKQQVRLLRIYLAATTFLFLYGFVGVLILYRNDQPMADHIGGIVAIVLGISALIYLARNPRNTAPALAAAIVATPMVMAFHDTMTAEYVCLIAVMFLAMYVRAFYPPRAAWILIAVLIAAVVTAVAVAPAPKVGVLITYLIMAIAIAGAAESFGLLVRALLTAACTDPMTGLLNRAGWELATAEMLSGRWSQADVVTVVALDIDNLKQLNDSFGHDAGDRRIVEYAAAWRRTAPRGAVLARLGGDEFAMCMAGHRPAVVDRLLDRIRVLTPHVSIGAVTEPRSGAVVAHMLSRADAALYASRGRPLRDDSRPAQGD